MSVKVSWRRSISSLRGPFIRHNRALLPLSSPLVSCARYNSSYKDNKPETLNHYGQIMVMALGLTATGVASAAEEEDNEASQGPNMSSPLRNEQQQMEALQRLKDFNAARDRRYLWEVLASARESDLKPALLDKGFLYALTTVASQGEEADIETCALEAVVALTHFTQKEIRDKIKHSVEAQSQIIPTLVSIANKHSSIEAKSLAFQALSNIAQTEAQGMEDKSVSGTVIRNLMSNEPSIIQPVLGILAQLAWHYREKGVDLAEHGDVGSLVYPVVVAVLHGVGGPRFILSFIHKDSEAKQPLVLPAYESAAKFLCCSISHHSFDSEELVKYEVVPALLKLAEMEDNPEAQKFALLGIKGITKRCKKAGDGPSKAFEEYEVPKKTLKIMQDTDNIWSKRYAAEALERMVRPEHSHVTDDILFRWRLKLSIEKAGKEDWLANKWAKKASKNLQGIEAKAKAKEEKKEEDNK
eukprot:gb/GECG01003220.1/.p1 GENE.gb/GECG01003220.1/~~gb/GECG01003220.1/.p1  ORF type:complete len:470 (+),score=70.27 gb/GECG01003220.1/:1-1410(+)